MNDTLSIVLTASAWAAGAGLAVWLVTMPLRRRSIVALLASIVLPGRSRRWPPSSGACTRCS